MFDSHCHIHDEKFDGDREEVLKRALKAGITHMVSVGCDVHTSRRAQEQAFAHDYIYFSAGFHPHEAQHGIDSELSAIKDIARDPKCVAIGECGLDFYYEHSARDIQIDIFIKQIYMAQELNKPLIIHVRDAYDECIAILEKHRTPSQKLVIHCFSGTLSQAQTFVAMGALISLSGIVTFKKPGELLEVARHIPLENLIIETDSPYLAPHPHRGKRNEPAYLELTLNAIAQAREQEQSVIAKKIFDNTMNFFSLSF
jgi:TatD DNase family protein